MLAAELRGSAKETGVTEEKKSWPGGSISFAHRAGDWKVIKAAMIGFGQRLRKARVKAGIQPEEAAQAAGVVVETYLRFETDAEEPDLDQMTTFVWLYHVSPSYLLDSKIFDGPTRHEAELLDKIDHLDQERREHVLELIDREYDAMPD